MPEPLRWYILFANYEQGLSLHDSLDAAGVPNRIAPTPRSIQGELSCGMSLLVAAKDLAAARQCIQQTQAAYHSIVSLDGQIQAGRDKYC